MTELTKGQKAREKAHKRKLTAGQTARRKGGQPPKRKAKKE